MPSFTTIYRTIMMLAIGAIVVQGWRLYGPSTEQVKSAVVSAIDMAQTAWKNRQPADGTPHSTADSRGTAPLFANTTQPTPADPAPPPAATLTPTNPNSVPVDVVPTASIPASREPITPPAEKTSQASNANDNRLPALLSRLEQLGAAEPKLAPWGSSGHLYRFCCRAALTDSPSYTRHFESVAAEPALAVEQVVAKVEAWRTAQRNDTVLRY